MHPCSIGPIKAAGPSASHHSHEHPIIEVTTVCSVSIKTSQMCYLAMPFAKIIQREKLREKPCLGTTLPTQSGLG